ncbi:MAG: motility-associated protein [Limisphaerales bacterium]|jgi:chemotaxis protein MotA
MVVIIGFVIIIGLTLYGFSFNGGNPMGLIHIGEIIPIAGMGAGCLVIMAPVKVLKSIVHGLLATLKGAPYKKADYEELLKCLYELFVLGRRGGMIALEEHVMNPNGSSLFKKYPKFHGNHHALDFLCDGLKPVVDGRIKPDQLESLMRQSVNTAHAEHHEPVEVLTKVADSMPAFGIVAAVLGIVLTMGKIDQGTTVVGASIGSALCGTFYGIFLSYGVIAPLATNIDFIGRAEAVYFNCIKEATVSFANGAAPLVACEVGRRVLADDVRPGSAELETMLKTMK